MKSIDVFLHPRRAANLIQEIREDNARLTELADNLREQLSCALEQVQATATELSESQKSQKELFRLLSDTRSTLGKQIESMHRQLDEARIDEAVLKEIDSQVERMKISQQRYRQRIADLKEDLAAARKEVAELTCKPSSPPRNIIHLGTSLPEDDSASDTATRDNAATASDSDWLIPLP